MGELGYQEEATPAFVRRACLSRGAVLLASATSQVKRESRSSRNRMGGSA